MEVTKETQKVPKGRKKGQRKRSEERQRASREEHRGREMKKPLAGALTKKAFRADGIRSSDGIYGRAESSA